MTPLAGRVVGALAFLLLVGATLYVPAEQIRVQTKRQLQNQKADHDPPTLRWSSDDNIASTGTRNEGAISLLDID